VRRLRIDPDRSTVVVEARSNVGPIAWEATNPVGEFSLADGDAAAPVQADGWLELRLDSLDSGNRVYNSELLRRVDAHLYPTARAELTSVAALGADATIQASGQVTFHGITRPVAGTVQLETRADGAVVVMAEQDLDIRDFGLPPPSMLMLKVYPDVRIHLIVHGNPIDEPDGPREH
jgi:polyisoprenoid-binding protein YceI